MSMNPEVEWLAREMLEPMLPLTIKEFAVLQDAIVKIERMRLVASGEITEEEAKGMSEMVDDFFAFEAAAKTD